MISLAHGYQDRKVTAESPDPMGDHRRYLDRARHDGHVCYVESFRFRGIYVEVYRGAHSAWHSRRNVQPRDCYIVEPSWMDPIRVDGDEERAIERARGLVKSWERQT